MGLFDSVVGALGGDQGTGGGMGKAALIQMVLQMLSNNGSAGGGIGALLQKLQAGGLGDVASSWVSSGPNQSISPNQLQDVLGSDLIGQIAAQLGISPQAASSQLAETLPQVVDQATPTGQLPPQDGDGFGDIGAILGRFG
jgi:uncharacterized protein YidB (DUF937 family)